MDIWIGERDGLRKLNKWINVRVSFGISDKGFEKGYFLSVVMVFKLVVL